MKASDVYDIVAQYGKSVPTTICDILSCCNPCSGVRPSHQLLNFDDIKTQYCKGRQQCPSVDALAYNAHNIFFMIEAKSWTQFDAHTVTMTEAKVNKKVSGFNFAGKLEHSLSICRNIMKNNNCSQSPSTVPLVYLVVTDASVESNPVIALASELTYLAGTSSDYAITIDDGIQKKLRPIEDIDNFYLNDCRQLDSTLDSYDNARSVNL